MIKDKSQTKKNNLGDQNIINYKLRLNFYTIINYRYYTIKFVLM